MSAEKRRIARRRRRRATQEQRTAIGRSRWMGTVDVVQFSGRSGATIRRWFRLSRAAGDDVFDRYIEAVAATDAEAIRRLAEGTL